MREVAHDMQLQVTNFVTGMGLHNSYDTWHGNNYSGAFVRSQFCLGTKNVAKELKKVTEGRLKDRGITWFPELTDKRKIILWVCLL